ncbi:hypothetical protein [Anaeromyxobacter terrae]|uniref:hypothetical protein n=1 Tax=Anaeromyxobacter terrae TaxID=2925406 RepID=UPI001F57E3C9|nr:hypothetical protein [Anaeromyxobacter sp. SG22]
MEAVESPATAVDPAPALLAPGLFMKLAVSLLCLLALPSLPLAAPPAGDPFAGVRFLLGDWVASRGSGKPGEQTAGSFSFSLGLDGHVAVRHARAKFAPRPGAKQGAKHEDLMVLSPAPSGLRATYWDDEGHVIEYGVRAEPGRAIFESSEAAPGPRFKLVYEQRGGDVVEVTFFIAPPGGDYQKYLGGLAHRK